MTHFNNFFFITFRSEKARDADEKFNKLKVMYGKLRQDHIDLLRKVYNMFLRFQLAFFYFFEQNINLY